METQLRDQIVDLFDDLISVAPSVPEFVVARMHFDQDISPDQLMIRFIKHVYPLASQINAREERFFLENTAFMRLIPGDSQHYVTFLRDLWDSPRLINEDKEVIWDHLQAMVETVDKHQHP